MDEIANDAPMAARLSEAGARLATCPAGRDCARALRKGRAYQDIGILPISPTPNSTARPPHNAIEPGAVIARWDADGGVTVHAATQWVHIDTLAIGQAFGLGADSGLRGFWRECSWAAPHRCGYGWSNHPSGGAFGRNLNTIR